MALDKKYSSFSIRPSEFADELGILYSNSVTPEHKKKQWTIFYSDRDFGIYVFYCISTKK